MAFMITLVYLTNIWFEDMLGTSLFGIPFSVGKHNQRDILLGHTVCLQGAAKSPMMVTMS